MRTVDGHFCIHLHLPWPRLNTRNFMLFSRSSDLYKTLPLQLFHCQAQTYHPPALDTMLVLEIDFTNTLTN